MQLQKKNQNKLETPYKQFLVEGKLSNNNDDNYYKRLKLNCEFFFLKLFQFIFSFISIQNLIYCNTLYKMIRKKLETIAIFFKVVATNRFF